MITKKRSTKIDFEIKNLEFLNKVDPPFVKLSKNLSEKAARYHVDGIVKTAIKKTIDHPGVLQFPEDFDIKQDMQEHPDNLYVKALAIVADEPNDNGDFFSTEELKKAYHTFVGCPLFVNHKNDDVEEARGTIVYAEWSDEENGIVIIGRVDAKAYPKLARGISEGYIAGVSMGCFTGDMRVLMSDGSYRPIKDVNSGDMVITHTGSVEEVLNVQIHKDKTDDDIYEIKVEGLPIPIKATKEHPFYTLKEQDKCFISGESIGLPKSYDRFKKRMKRGMWQKEQYKEVISSENFTRFEFEWKESSELKEGDMVSFPISNYEKHDKNATINNARLIGYFLAEGNFIKRKNEKVGIEFTFSLEEKNTLAKEVSDLLLSEFNIIAKEYEREEKNTITIKVNSREIAEWFYKYCSEYSHEKRMDESCLYWPKKIQRHIIASFFNGDGYWRNIYDKRVNKYYSNISFTTSSETLHNQMRFLLARCGIYSTSSHVDRKDRERPYYITSISCKESEALKQYVKDGYLNDEYRKASFRKTETHLVMPIKSINKRFNTETVYNLEVKNDNSFIVEGVAVHNCQVEYSECSICKNQAAKEEEYCTHIKEHKTRKINGKTVYEKNYGLKFIELSFVVDPACSTCFIQEIFDIDDLKQKVAQIQDFTGKFRKIASKMAGKAELDKLDQAENLIQEVAKTMLDQKAQLELTYVTDLVEALAKLQETKDELIDMGYESLQTTPGSSDMGTEPAVTVMENAPQEEGQNLEEPNINYENVGAMPAGEVGSITTPGPIASAFRKKITKHAKKSSLSKVFKTNLRKKWNKE